MIACVRLPYFATALAQRDNPALAGEPLVIEDLGQVHAVSEEASRAGVEVGMTTREARALCPGITCMPAGHSHHRLAFDALLESLTRFTSLVEPESGLELRADARRQKAVAYLQASQVDDRPAATCYLDLGELARDEALEMGHHIHRAVWQQAGLVPAIGLASGKFTARALATSLHPGDLVLVVPGKEAQFLAGYPVSLLPIDVEAGELPPRCITWRGRSHPVEQAHPVWC